MMDARSILLEIECIVRDCLERKRLSEADAIEDIIGFIRNNYEDWRLYDKEGL